MLFGSSINWELSKQYYDYIAAADGAKAQGRTEFCYRKPGIVTAGAATERRQKGNGRAIEPMRHYGVVREGDKKTDDAWATQPAAKPRA